MSTITTTQGGTNNTSGTSTGAQTYTPNLPAGILAMVNQGAGMASQATANNPYAGLLHGVAGFNDGQWNTVAPNLQGIAGYAPQNVQAGNIARYAGGTGAGGLSAAGMNLAPYMNPYTQDVINQSDRDINRQSTIQQQQNNGQAAMAGAFGGDRAAIVNTETARNAADTMARTDAALRSQNFTQALGQANTDLSRQLQAGTTQAQMDLQAGQGNQFAGLQGENLKLNATGQLSNLYGQDQQTRQKMLDAQYEHDSNNALWPQNNASWLLSQAQKLPYGSLTGTSSTNNSSTTGIGATTGNQVAPGPSTLGQIGGALTAGVGVLGALGGAGGAAGGLGAIGNGISAVGSGVGNAYNWLTGGGPSASQAADLFNGAGTGAEAASSIGSSAGDAAGLFDGAGSDTFASIFAAGGRVGGIAGYAKGGTVDGDDSHWDADAYWARRNRTRATDDGAPPAPSMQEYVHGAPTINPDGAYADGYAPQPAGPGATANLGIASAAPQDVPAPQPDDEPEPQAPPPPPSIPMGEHATDAGTQGDDYGLPVPPIPPQRDASPSAPAAPSGPVRPVAAPVSGGIATVRQAEPTGGADAGLQQGLPARKDADPLWMSLIRAGGAMMASKSHTALGALGEGVESGAASYTQAVQNQQRNDLARYQADALAQYRQGTLANGQARVANGSAAIDEKARHNAATEQVAQQKLAASASAAALKAQSNKGLTGAQQMESAIEDFRSQNPGMSYADAYQHMKGFDFKQAAAAQGDARVAQGQVRADNDTTRTNLAVTRDANTDAQRGVQNQQRANAAEDAAAKTIVNSAANMGKTVTYADALNQVRSQRAAIGPAPVPPATPGQGVAGLRAAAGAPAPAAANGQPTRVSTPQEAAALPPGALFIGPDGITRRRPAQ